MLNNNKCSLCSSSFVELTTESLDQVRPAKALTIKSKRTSDKPTDCTICLNPMVDTRTNEDTFVALECGHKYHRECIEGWLDEHNTCPLCRVRVDVSSVNDKLRGQPRDRDLLSLDYMERIMVQFEQIRSMILDIRPVCPLLIDHYSQLTVYHSERGSKSCPI